MIFQQRMESKKVNILLIKNNGLRGKMYFNVAEGKQISEYVCKRTLSMP